MNKLRAIQLQNWHCVVLGNCREPNQYQCVWYVSCSILLFICCYWFYLLTFLLNIPAQEQCRWLVQFWNRKWCKGQIWQNGPCCRGGHRQRGQQLCLWSWPVVSAGTSSRKKQWKGSGGAFDGNSMLVHGKPTYPCVWTPREPCELKHQHRVWPDLTRDCQLETFPVGLVGFSRCLSHHSRCTYFPSSALLFPFVSLQPWV